MVQLVLERRGPGAAPQCPSADDRMGDVHVPVSLETARPGRPVSCAAVTDGERMECYYCHIIQHCFRIVKSKGKGRESSSGLKINSSSVAHDHHPSW